MNNKGKYVIFKKDVWEIINTSDVDNLEENLKVIKKINTNIIEVIRFTRTEIYENYNDALLASKLID